MPQSKVKDISKILQSSSLGKIVQRSALLYELNQKMPKLLPEKYRGLYRVANLVDNLLKFDVKNATIRQGLLLQQPMLLTAIQQDYPQITQLEFRVSPSFSALNIGQTQ